ncbi:MAG: hypothetical protein MK212_20325 [Saprospiraceae bacterium]|nr:hypothetical protein [Saprospiraceae bacterium]
MKIIKTITVILLAQLLTFSAFAQSPDLINYQAVARNSSGSAIQNQAISIRVSILQGSATGTIAYQEIHNPSTDANGAFNLQIGDGSVQTGTFAGINWGNFSHYLRIEMDATGGTNYSVMGTTQMVSVPYAKYAETAGSVETGNALIDKFNGSFMVFSGSSCSQNGCSGGYGGSYLESSEGFTVVKSKNFSDKAYFVADSWFEVTFSNTAITDIQPSSLGVSETFTMNSATISADNNTLTINHTYTDSFGTCVCTDTLQRK